MAREGATGSAGRTESTSTEVGDEAVLFDGMVADSSPERTRVDSLPERPDLDQLRRQARELVRATLTGDPAAVARLAAVAAATPTLHAAQLAIAREFGFSSWTALKEEVTRRRDPASFVIRAVRSRVELAEVFDVAGAQFWPPFTHTVAQFDALDARLDQDRSLMLAALAGGRIAGGALAFRSRSGAVTLRIIGLVPEARGRGVGTQLVESLAGEAARLGSPSIAVGGVTADVRGFYQRLGFRGRRSMMRLELYLPVPVTSRR